MSKVWKQYKGFSTRRRWIQYCELRQNFVAPYWSGHGPTAGCSAYVCQLRAWSPHITKQRLLVIGCRGMAGAQVAAKTWFNRSTLVRRLLLYMKFFWFFASHFLCFSTLSRLLISWINGLIQSTLPIFKAAEMSCSWYLFRALIPITHWAALLCRAHYGPHTTASPGLGRRRLPRLSWLIRRKYI